MATNTGSKPVLRQISESAVIAVLRRDGARSRADLAKDTGLSKQTMSEVMRVLASAGWVRETGTTSGHVGRSAVLYEIDGRVGCVAGIDIGANWLRLSLTNVTGAELATREIRTETLGESLIETIAQEVLALVATQSAPLRYAGISVPGVIDPTTGFLTMAPQLPDLMETDLKGRMQDALDCPVVIENDVNSAVLGEYWRGDAKARNVAYLSLGTGVGMGTILNGQLMRGARGAAGEVAFLPIGGDPTNDASRKVGTLETQLGARALLDMWRANGGRGESIADLSIAARSGEDSACTVVAHAGRLAAQLVLSVQAILDPEIVVIGGHVGSLPVMFDAIQSSFDSMSLRPVQITSGRLGARAAVLGIASHAIEVMFNDTFTPMSDG